MAQSIKTPVRHAERPVENSRDAELRKVSEEITTIEKNCGAKGFDPQTVEDIGGMLTAGVCLRCGVNLEAERLGVSLLDDDRRSIESDMASRLRSNSGPMAKAADEVLAPLLKNPGKEEALANWAVVNKRLDSRKAGDAEGAWLKEEEDRQDKVLMKDAGAGFRAVLSRDMRKSALSIFSRIRRAGNKVPVVGRLLGFK
ncbi:MAG: hypothetical protein PHG85_05530 [Candidatus Altiarchaeota archaeon]|nr:hypothetical protein [Candidatus Altiarchaeota archaeon]